MIAWKPGVSVRHLSEYALFALVAAERVFDRHGYGVIVTSAVDGSHSRTSLHHRGDALDLRSKHIAKAQEKEEIRKDLKKWLGKDYDVLLEGIGTENEHYHIEFQPKRLG